MRQSKGEGTAVASIPSLIPGALITAAQGSTSQCGICCSKVHGGLTRYASLSSWQGGQSVLFVFYFPLTASV